MTASFQTIAQTVYYSLNDLVSGSIINSVVFFLDTDAAVITTWVFGIYDRNFKLVASSGNLAAAVFGTAPCYATGDLSTPYTVGLSGPYYAAAMCDATTAPKLGSVASTITGSAAAFTTLPRHGKQTAQASLPATAVLAASEPVYLGFAGS